MDGLLTGWQADEFIGELSLYPQFLHLIKQGLSADLKNVGCFGSAVIVFLESFENQFSLHLPADSLHLIFHPKVFFGFVLYLRISLNTKRQVLGKDGFSLAYNESAVNSIFQFPDVPLPIVGLKTLEVVYRPQT